MFNRTIKYQDRDPYYQNITLEIMQEQWTSYFPIASETLDKVRASDNKKLNKYLSDVRLNAIYRGTMYGPYEFNDTIRYLHLWNDELIIKSENDEWDPDKNELSDWEKKYWSQVLKDHEDFVVQLPGSISSTAVDSLSKAATAVITGLTASQLLSQGSTTSHEFVSGLLASPEVNETAVSNVPAVAQETNYFSWILMGASAIAFTAFAVVIYARRAEVVVSLNEFKDALPYTIYGKRPPSEVQTYKYSMIATAEAEKLLTDEKRMAPGGYPR